MRKFNGLLLVSDFDNSLVYTEEALQKCVDMPPVSDENRAAIEYFMANGGIFSVATGRAKPAFETVVDGIPMNGPTVLFNGAAIYDFPQKKYLVTAFPVSYTHLTPTTSPAVICTSPTRRPSR